jgi:hypothetical protein
MPEPEAKSTIQWLIWGVVTILVAFITNYFSHKDTPSAKVPDININNRIESNSTEDNGAKNKKTDYVVNEDNRTEDEKITQKLIGKWKGSSIIDGMSYVGIVTYKANGRFSGVINESVYYSGTWEVNKEVLLLNITESNEPMFFPVGKTLTGKIIDITDDDCTYKDDYGVIKKAQKL